VQRAALIIFITPKLAVTKAFGVFINWIYRQQKIKQVMLDEYHTLLEWLKIFRLQIGILGRILQGFKVPVIYLTAILKPSEEAWLFSKLGFNPKQMQIFQEQIIKTNITYWVDIVKNIKKKDEKNIIRRLNTKRKGGKIEKKGREKKKQRPRLKRREKTL
jgi:superfamily II DNA helicase RecQ